MMKDAVKAIVEDPELIEKRRAQIVGAATKLFSKQGFYCTNTKEIAKAAGMSAGLIYQYVREKDDVLLLVLLEVVEAYAREIPSALVGITDPLERLLVASSEYYRVVDRHRAETVLAYRSTKSLSEDRRETIMKREHETNQIITKELLEAMKAGLVRKANADVLTYQIVLSAHGWALKGWHFKARLDVEEYIDETLENLLGGVLTTRGAKQYERLRKGRSGASSR
jgi:AcrR family transcriptional regulator